MARFLDSTASIKKEAGKKSKKKKEQKKAASKPQSSSAPKKNYTSNAAKNIVNNTVGGAKKTTKKIGQTASKQKSKSTVDRLSTKYGGGSTRSSQISSQSREKRNNRINTRPRKNEALSRNPRIQDTSVAPTRRQASEMQERARQQRPRTAREEQAARQAQKMGISTYNRATGKAESPLERKDRKMADQAVTTTKRIAAEYGTTATDILRSANTGFSTKEFNMDAKEVNRRLKASEQARGQASKLYDKLGKMQDKYAREDEERKKGESKLFRGILGAEDSGIGMVSDWAAGRLFGGRWEVPLAIRSYGGAVHQAEKEGASRGEARLNALLNAGIEIGTEHLAGIYGGLGKLTRGGKAAKGITERAEEMLTRGIGSKLGKDLAGFGFRTAADTLGEIGEEWIANPLENLGSNLIYGNRVQKENEKKYRDPLTKMSEEIQTMYMQDPVSRDRFISTLNDPSYKQNLIDDYVSGGMSKKEAESLANTIIDMQASAAMNDKEGLAKQREDAVRMLAGDVRKKVFDWDDMLETTLSTALLTAPLGMASNAGSAAMGAMIRDSKGGRDKIMSALKKQMALDPENSDKAKSMLEAMEADESYTPSGTQVYDIMQGESAVMRVAVQNQNTANRMKQKGMRRENLMASPSVQLPDGSYVVTGEATAKRFAQDYSETRDYMDTVNAMWNTTMDEDTEKRTATSVASFKTGSLTAAEIFPLTLGTEHSEEARYVFSAMTGVDLDQYNVYDKNGKLNVPKSNGAMQQALFAMSADNYMQSARIEQENWNDQARGVAVEKATTNMGIEGDKAMQTVLQTVDPRDKNKFDLTANAASEVYNWAVNTEGDWDEIRQTMKSVYPTLDASALEDVFEAGKRDRIIADTPFYGRTVQIGQAMDAISEGDAKPVIRGKFINKSSVIPKASTAELFQTLADSLNIDIVLVNDLSTRDENGVVTGSAEGQYIDGQIILSANLDKARAIHYVLSHELTHHLETYAPSEYQELMSYVRDKWYRQDRKGYEEAIAARKERYKGRQELTDEGALSEIIADASNEFWGDEEFVTELCNDNPNLAKKILDAINEILRKIRDILAKGIRSPESNRALYSELEMYDEAKRLWLNAYTEAKKNAAAVSIARWDQNAWTKDKENETRYKEKETGTTRFSLSEPVENLDRTNTAVDNEDGEQVAQFYDSGAVKFSISTSENGGRNMLQKYLDNLVANDEMSLPEADTMMKEYDTVYEICKKFADAKDENGDPVYLPFTSWSYANVVVGKDGKAVFSAVKKNSEYMMNIDFSTICKKRRTLDAVFREMINRGMFQKLDLNKDESAAMVVNINDLIRKHGFEAACALCFVEARRYRQQQTAKTFTDMYNNLVETLYPDKDKIAYFNFGEDSTVEDVPDGIHTMNDEDLDLSKVKAIAEERNEKGNLKMTAEAKAARLILNNPSQRKLMRVGDMMASTGFENMQTQNPELMKVYNSKKGTGGAKSSFGDVQYLNEIIRSAKFDRMKAYAVSGVRIQSFSDYVPRMVFDYVQVIADLAAKKLPAHAYTKEVLFARQFGLTGAKINLSLVPDVVEDGIAPGLDANGDYIWNEEGTFPYDEAMELQKAEGYKENCGTIAVGISDEQIRKMLADPTIQMVIPYHKSSLNPIVAAMTNVDRFTNYEDSQNTRNQEGKAVKTDFNWDKKLFGLTHYTRGEKTGELKPKEKWGNVQDLVKEYVDWCEKKGYTPKFDQFLYMEDGSINPGYYKLLEDFALFDNDGNFKPQGDVQMRFPTESDAFGSMESLIEQGLEEDAILEGKRQRDINGIVDEIEQMYEEGTLATDNRYSIAETDSDGNSLTDAQRRFFNDSLAVDKNGRLVPVYHGTFRAPRITIFAGSDDGYWFTSNRDIAEDYSMGYEMGMIGAKVGTERNPYDSDEEYFAKKGITIEQDADGYWNASIEEDGRKQYWGAAESKEELIEGLYESAETEESFDSRFTLRDYYPVYLNLENPKIIECGGTMHDNVNGTGMSTRDLAAEAKDDGYDGIIFLDVVDPFEAHDVYVAFSAEQIKDIRNENPTENPDIRWSIPEDDEVNSRIAYENSISDSYDLVMQYEASAAMGEADAWMAGQAWLAGINEEDLNKFYAGLNDDEAVPFSDPVLEEDRVRMAKSKSDFYAHLNAKWQDRWTTEGELLDIKSVRKDIKELVTGVMANSDTTAKYRNDIVKKTLFDLRTAYQLSKQGRADIVSALLYHSAQRMIDGVEFYIDDTFNDYKELRDYLKVTKISLGEEYWAVVDYDAFRKRNFGRLKLVKGNTDVDEVYKVLCDRFPQWFNEEEEMNPADQLLQIEYALDTVQPYKEAYSSEAAAELAFDIADSLYDIMEGGKEYKSLADTYKERFDAKTKAMKQRHAEAMLRMRQQAIEGVQAERAKWRAKEERRKERAEHTKRFDQLKNNYDWLTERLLNPTKEKNIPEQLRKPLAELLQLFDFQTERSKSLEERYGKVARKTLKMRELKDKIAAVSAEDDSGELPFNSWLQGTMEQLAEQLDGAPIDSLNTQDIRLINEVLTTIIHGIRNRQNLIAKEKQETIAKYGDGTITAMDSRMEKYGPRKQFQGKALQWLETLVNEGMETASYFFGRIDPNNTGIGALYKDLERGEDKYIENTAFLRRRMREITGKYMNRKRPGSKVEAWRKASNAIEFNLESGETISLTPAQIMSIYCLNKRPQAQDHLYVGGIATTPASVGSVLQSFKRKAQKVSAARVTPADVQNMITKLTPEQKQVADQLQSLMSNEMSDWGNETSMQMYGIKMFKEKEYFPLKVSREVLPNDLDKVAGDTNEKIRNFGFTKPLTPNAQNAVYIDDIFAVAADHCNKMALYNAMAIPIMNFNRVYNYKQKRDDGSVSTVQEKIGDAFTNKANAYIKTFLSDLNGNTQTRSDATEALVKIALSNYKKAAIGLNGRVALQQVTALPRAFMEINPKYFAGTFFTPTAMRDMFEHCPKALWKSWGNYEMDLGRDMEDVMMSKDWSRLDAIEMGIYGMLDNYTWTKIWQAVKRETKAKHKNVEYESQEFYDICNERARDIFNRTQVVDSLFNRSAEMRSKNQLTKMLTSFKAEPTLTYNVFRNALVNGAEKMRDGDIAGGAATFGKAAAVLTLCAAYTSAMAALWDAVRRKGADDDEDKKFSELWWLNFLDNFFNDNAPWKQWNNIYFISDAINLKDGWGTSNMAFEGFEAFWKGYNDLIKKLNGESKKSWYDIAEELVGGIGYIFGFPAKTVMHDPRQMLKWFGIDVFAADGTVNETIDKAIGGLVDKTKSLDLSEGPDLGSKLNDLFGGYDPETEAFVVNRPVEEDESEYDKLEEKAAEIANSTNIGTQRNSELWSALTNGYTKSLADADFERIDKLRAIYKANGGDVDIWDEKIMKACKTAYKKTLIADATSADLNRQEAIREYMTNHGVTDAEISDLCYRSDTAKDLKAAMRLNNEDLMVDEMVTLMNAGISDEDLIKLYDNRNRGRDTYDGKYKDLFKSTGTYKWPINGSITSNFGHRSSPGGIGSTYHQGLDIAGNMGDPVGASDGGTVIFAGWYGGAGKTVKIEHDDGTITQYSHLSWWGVKEGDVVGQGQTIGNVGSTGNSTGPHLHFGVIKDGSYVNPREYLSE